MKILSRILLLLLCISFIVSCAAGPNKYQNLEGEKKPAGFFSGLWHGIITPIAFIVSLFNSNVNIYEVNNIGGWYNFGFVLGVSIIFGGSGGGTGRMICRDK